MTTTTTIAEPPGAFTTDADRKKLMMRLARVEGQLRGVQKMIEAGEECEPVAQQLAAARSALDRAFFAMIACAFKSKLGSDAPSDVEERLDELAGLLAKYA